MRTHSGGLSAGELTSALPKGLSDWRNDAMTGMPGRVRLKCVIRGDRSSHGAPVANQNNRDIFVR